MSKVYGVNFNKGGKTYYFNSEIELKEENTVIVETEKGEQYGKIVNELLDEVKISKLKDLKNIIRKTTKKDYEQFLKNLKEGDIALKKCKELAKELNLDMNFVNETYTFNRNQLIFNFYADARVDFRELAKRLAGLYKTRIELRQIGARDKAKEVCGICVCGQKLCCARFLNQMESVSINMAKNQNIALNPSKINGACNRLLCCLAYEDDVYTENRKELPNYGEKVKVNKEEGIVRQIDILKKKYIVETKKEKIEVVLDEKSSK